MRHVWIDLANSPHVLFFAPLVADLRAAGHSVTLSARDFAQTVPLCKTFGLDCVVVGEHGGSNLARKGFNLIGRAAQLVRFGRGRGVDVGVSHNSYAHAVATRALRIPTVTLMDYEYQPANHLSFRIAHRVLVPRAFDAAVLRRCGASPRRTVRYDGLKEEVYLDGFEPAADFRDSLVQVFSDAGIAFDPQQHVLATVRPPATMAAYHRFDNPLFDRLLERLREPQVRGILLPRTAEQRHDLEAVVPPNVVMPTVALDGRELIAGSDVVISAGGTMIREAAVLGTTAFSIYAGRLGGVDRELVRQGRLQRIETVADVGALRFERRLTPATRVHSSLRQQVAAEILGMAKGSA